MTWRVSSATIAQEETRLIATLTITLTNLSAETLAALAARAAERKAASPEAYVQELIEQNVQIRLQPASMNIEEHPLAEVAGSMSGETWREWMKQMEHEHMEENMQAAQSGTTPLKRTLKEILALIHEQVEESGISDEELETLFECARNQVYDDKQAIKQGTEQPA